MTTQKWDYGPAHSLHNGLTITEDGGAVTRIREGELLFRQISRRHSMRWRSQVPLGSLEPVRTATEKPPHTLTLRGGVYMPRLAAARAHLAKLESLRGETIDIVLNIDGSTGRYYVDDVTVDWQFGGSLELGCEWEVTMTAAPPAVAPTTPPPSPPTPPPEGE